MERDGFFVSPSEPARVRALGETSSLAEVHGCDVIWTGPNGLVGVQRKTLRDLVVSLRDGRLATATARMALLDVKVLLIEGRPRWSESGHLLDVPVRIHRTALRGVLWSAQQRGLWVVQTVDVSDTVDALVHLRSWVGKRRHVAFDRMRPGQAEVGSRAWGVQLLQSFPLVGPVVAGAIWDHFGRAPLRWDAEASDLASVRGVGPVRAAQLLLSLPADAADAA